MSAPTLNVRLLLRAVCPLCACSLRGMSFRKVRVNKHSVVTTGIGLAFMRPCPECGSSAPDHHEIHMSPEDQQRIDARRLK